MQKSGRLISPAIACFAVVLFCGQASAAPKDQLRELRERIEAVQKRLTESEESRASAADALKSSEHAISETNRKLYHLSGQRRAANNSLSRLQAQSREIEANIAQEQRALGQLLYRQYLSGQSEAIKLVLNREDPNEIARQLHYLGYVSRARGELIASLRENLAQLDKLTGETRRKSTELRALQDEESQQKQKLEKEKAERQRVYAEVSSDIEKSRQQLSTLKKDEERLTALMERLAKEAAARANAKKKPGKRLTNKALPDAETGAGEFRQLKGRLRLPVIGELTNRFGSQRQDSGLSWKGLFISAKTGREVKAIASGKIVYADWLRGFGNLLILDHGDGYMSLYGNNESLLKQAGEDAKAGDTIASVGASGGNPESGLYFELRYQGKPFDPLPWVTLR
ncbi:MAG TPA: peptidoglycan DD-metalloendopeptidase family protein [Burkholderiales bacterium]|nr:peptidoglycan DD-metalloendopeptidase family protein [Burkholderiales bacterium]